MKLLGYILLALPVVGLTALMLKSMTWRMAIALWGSVLVVVAVILLGVWIVTL